MRIASPSLALLAFLAAACRSEHHSGAPPLVEAQAPPELDEAALKAKSRALMEAYDRMDEIAFTGQLGKSFVRLEALRIFDRKLISERMSRGKQRGERGPSRTWMDESVRIAPNVAVYIADSREHFAAEGEAHPEHDYDGWNTLVWAKEGAEWKLASWQIANGGVRAYREDWNDTYRQRPTFKVQPNQLLVDTVKGKPPGTALDLMTGQGRNAVFLASLGWKTTGVDISDEGLRIAQENASRQKVKLETINADVDTWDMGRDRWDLITMIYAGDDTKLIERVKSASRNEGSSSSRRFTRKGRRRPESEASSRGSSTRSSRMASG
jgi:hypothetical protein